MSTRPLLLTAEVARLAVGVLLLAVGGLAAIAPGVSAVEERVFRAVNGWPAGLEPTLVVLMMFGSLYGVLLASAMAAAAQRVSLALDLMVTGALAWLLTNYLLKPLVARGRPIDLIVDALIRGGSAGGFGYPSGHATVAAGLAAAASVHLSRRWRWLVWALAATIALARLYVGAHLPADIIGGFGVGLVAAATWRLIRRPAQAAAPG